MIFVSCLAKNPVTIRLECDGALSLSGGDALYTQNMNHNVLSRSIRDVESLCYLSNANMAIFEYNFLYFFDVIVVNRGGWTTRMRHFCNIFNDSVAAIPLETQNFKQTRCSIFFSIIKIARQTFRVVNQWLLNTH